MADDTLAAAKVYEAIQKAISETDAVSFKLMAAVPLVSGTGLLAILFGQNAPPIPILSLLSLFAAAVTLGLFWWELWNIQTCHWFINLAHELEERALASLKLPEEKTTRPEPPGMVGKHNAAKVIYATTIGAWLLLPTAMTGFWIRPYVREGLYVACALLIAADTVRAVLASTDPAHGRARRAANEALQRTAHG